MEKQASQDIEKCDVNRANYGKRRTKSLALLEEAVNQMWQEHLLLTKHTLYYSVWNIRKHLLVDMEQRWKSHFRLLVTGVPLHHSTLHLPFLSAMIIQWAVISRHTSCRSMSSSFLLAPQQLWN